MNFCSSFSIDSSDEEFFYKGCGDTTDYALAVACGSIAGFIDVVFVGSPLDCKWLSWVDTKVDECVKNFAELCGWNRKADHNDINKAIAYLEKKFKVNYDQSHSGEVGGKIKMSPKNHHMKSLGHSPDIIGLFFSIVNQFTDTSTYIDNGKIITIDTDYQELRGNTFLSKLFCGFVNWLGHLMSDVAGSSQSIGRGSGIVAPFYELFGLCNFGSFGEDNQTIAQLATSVYERGYDARFGAVLAIPYAFCELSVRLVWAIRRYYCYGRPFFDCIPTSAHGDFRMMQIIAMGTYCLIDGIDAFWHAKPGSDKWISFFMRTNYMAWMKFAKDVIREIAIRIGILQPFVDQLIALHKIEIELRRLEAELDNINIDQIEAQTKALKSLNLELKKVKDPQEVNEVLTKHLQKLEIASPFKTSTNVDNIPPDFIIRRN